MKYIKQVLVIIIAFFIVFSSGYLNILANTKDDSANRFTEEEKNWLENNKDKTFSVGMLPILGIEYFEFNGLPNGYMEPLLKEMSSDLGINMKLVVDRNWNDVYSKFQNNEIDVLYGANVTNEREKFMTFTKPLLKNPYVIIAKKDGSIKTIGDIDKKKVGFIDNDFVVNELPNQYKNIKYHKSFFPSNEEGINALKNNDIDAFITTGGPFMYDYLYKYPELSYVFKINAITSDMTLSAKQENKMLIDILNKEITKLESNRLPQIINNAEVNYNLKTINLTEAEKSWIFNDGTAVVGVTKDYLPFDYYENGEFKGIDGRLIKEISRMTGIKFSYDYDDFDVLQEKLIKGEINILNIAKTEKNSKRFIFTEPYIKERDIVVGRKEAEEVGDIFGLEGKSVAVIKGFWHKELLTKNLTKVNIVETENIRESMALLNKGKVDYLIENPTVIKYYVKDLQYYDLIEKGTTSTDSFLYLGTSSNKQELASVINKVLPMIDINEISRKGYEEVPYKNYNKRYLTVNILISSLIVLLAIIGIYAARLIKTLIKEKTEKELLAQREQLLSIDSLTELHNRNYFNSKVLNNLDNLLFPQVLIVADLNNLKAINDKFGHQNGDLLLKTFADALKEACPPGSLLFRIGGDEFFILLLNSSDEEAVNIIKSVNLATSSKIIKVNEDKEIKLSAALGYAIRYSTEMSFDELYTKADREMYVCKRKTKRLKESTVLNGDKI